MYWMFLETVVELARYLRKHNRSPQRLRGVYYEVSRRIMRKLTLALRLAQALWYPCDYRGCIHPFIISGAHLAEPLSAGLPETSLVFSISLSCPAVLPSLGRTKGDMEEGCPGI